MRQTGKTKVIKSISIDRDLMHDALELSLKKRRSFSNMIEMLIRKALEENRNQEQ